MIFLETNDIKSENNNLDKIYNLPVDCLKNNSIEDSIKKSLEFLMNDAYSRHKKNNFFRNFFLRIWGKAYPYPDLTTIQSYHGRRSAHIDVKWTTPEHFAHNNYDRSHLPQLCLVASGWKARLIAFIFLPQKPWKPKDI